MLLFREGQCHLTAILCKTANEHPAHLYSNGIPSQCRTKRYGSYIELALIMAVRMETKVHGQSSETSTFNATSLTTI